jgi:hypothetical protein
MEVLPFGGVGKLLAFVIKVGIMTGREADADHDSGMFKAATHQQVVIWSIIYQIK